MYQLICTYTYTNTHTHSHMHVHIHIHTYIHTKVHSHMHTHAHTYTHTHYSGNKSVTFLLHLSSKRSRREEGEEEKRSDSLPFVFSSVLHSRLD